MEKRYRPTFKAAFSLSFLVLTLLPVVLVFGFVYMQSREWARDLVFRETLNMIRINHLKLEALMEDMGKSMDLLNQDPDLRELIAEMDLDSEENYLQYRQRFSAITGKYFQIDDALLGVELVTPAYTLSWADKLGIDKTGYQQSYIYKDLMATYGRTKWYSTYSSLMMYSSNSLDPGRSVFTAGKRLDSTRGDAVRPILLVHFAPSLFESLFDTDGLFEETIYIVVDSYSNTVYEGDPGFFAENKYDLLRFTFADLDGVESFVEEGMVLNYCLLDGPDWRIISVTPIASAVQYFWRDFQPWALLLAGCAVVFALAGTLVLTKTFAAPLQELAGAIDRTASGDFETPLPATRSADFQQVFDRYGEMNRSIKSLIRENTDVKLREKELELQVLNLQYNPHFLYNTLNSINLMAIMEDQTEISELLTHLSSILRYSVNVKDAIVRFKEDFAYIESYVALMQARYDNGFDFVTEIEPAVFDLRVPKFILQPLVENAILHGVQGLDRRGVIRLSASLRNGQAVFVLEDNGKGIAASSADSATGGSMVGLANTENRLRFYYGANYSLEFDSTPGVGTKITIRISTEVF